MEDTEICDLEDETKSDSESDVAVAKTLEENGACLWSWDPNSLTANAQLVDGSRRQVQGIHYWKVMMTTKCYGTDMMIGVCTRDFEYQHFTKMYKSLLGHDNLSWGLSFTGNIWHDGRVSQYMDPFSHGDVIGVRVNMNSGTLEFSKNGQWQGVAYHGLHKQEGLYAIVCSTAAKTGMRLLSNSSSFSSLQAICSFTIARNLTSTDDVRSLPLPRQLQVMVSDYGGYRTA
ncbi:SPRY domain-containing SOCS box protein 3-like isoform X2 [Corticium candelabrum]|uniref:SPRY domain-containing SOCS box protein 3-like isoform X2 n=1 Tax=Corticium candelabrum TaxID=121492 RepID=UPI002E340B4B|nr:SPRY domain-containing SOCS box protein 3-like isoform X2 [Corticium candelabrum]